ncbi:RNA polymerase II C-terminal domain phosphatase-like protein 2 isoform X2, partial [Tanacetum coccineum]
GYYVDFEKHDRMFKLVPVAMEDCASKSLLNMFQDQNCHPGMAMIIDDRLIWEGKDQPRVHVVPAFAPYYAPQAEVPKCGSVLCVERNVACNVRGGFFKEFDENLPRRLFEYFYEDETSNLPSALDVSIFLMSEVSELDIFGC